MSGDSSGGGGNDSDTPAGILVDLLEDSSTSSTARSFPFPVRFATMKLRSSFVNSAVRCLRWLMEESLS